MTDIEQKAREVAHGIVSDWLKNDSGTEIEQRDKLVSHIAAAIQSAVIGTCRGEVAAAIRARAQAKEKPKR